MPLRTINRINISTDLCQILRLQIANGDLVPGKHVNEVHLAEKLQVTIGDLQAQHLWWNSWQAEKAPRQIRWWSRHPMRFAR